MLSILSYYAIWITFHKMELILSFEHPHPHSELKFITIFLFNEYIITRILL